MFSTTSCFDFGIESDSATGFQKYAFFDFGRSSEGEGTYKFKKQWGAKPTPLVWYDSIEKRKTKTEPSQFRTLFFLISACRTCSPLSGKHGRTNARESEIRSWRTPRNASGSPMNERNTSGSVHSSGVRSRKNRSQALAKSLF